MNYYKIYNTIIKTDEVLDEESIDIQDIDNAEDIPFLYTGDRDTIRLSENLHDAEEGVDLFRKCEGNKADFMSIEAIKNALPMLPARKTVTIIGLGDVGGTLAIGLRLQGGDILDKIRLFDPSPEKMERYEKELNQIYAIDDSVQYPEVETVPDFDTVFDCDVLIFTASKAIPPVGSKVEDVRLYQFKDNAKIIKIYADMAKKKNFKGIFAVVSDPVDLLSKVVLDHSGLRPSQVMGFGQGVMYARARYYANLESIIEFNEKGRIFGPHGSDLVVANDFENYVHTVSERLTKQTVEANLVIREIGFKPYIAPALSSGALSILDMLRGKWHHSSQYLGGVFFGARYKIQRGFLELEHNVCSDVLIRRLEETHRKLEVYYEENAID